MFPRSMGMQYCSQNSISELEFIKRFVYFGKEFRFIFFLRKSGNRIHKLVLPVIVGFNAQVVYLYGILPGCDTEVL